MSQRTYSRRVSELLSYLGVASRFEAGVEAALRGWIDQAGTVKFGRPGGAVALPGVGRQV